MDKGNTVNSSSSTKGNEFSDPFPFNVVVVTSPDSTAARAAEIGPLASISSSLGKDVLVISTSDPLDVRCGSGGGTLAALDVADSRFPLKTVPSVLIVHAGGDSSRCPTQMALGKAWTSLPLLSSPAVGNPTHMIIESLGDLFRGAPRGTVVVAASDCLFSLGPDSYANIDYSDEESVIGLTVPSPLETATNHGVFVLDSDDYDNEESVSELSNVRVQPVERFFQKPSVEAMRQTQHCSFVHSVTQEECAWVDTGVVAFLPKSAMALRHLANGTLKPCTERGLKELYKQENSLTMDLKEFAHAKSLRVELYTHLLLALSTNSTTNSLASYLSDHDDLDPQILSHIHSSLSQHSLKTFVFPNGHFIHLGTTRELLDFLTFGASWTWNLTDHNSQKCISTDTPTKIVGTTRQDILEKRCREFGERVGLVRRLSSFLVFPRPVNAGDGPVVDRTSVSVDSMVLCTCPNGSKIGVGQTSTVGRGTALEHIALICPDGLAIGNNCYCSGIRGRCDSGRVEIPDGMCLQMLPLNRRNQVPADVGLYDRFVYMYFAVNDDIKKSTSLYGMKTNDVLRMSGLCLRDIWDETIEAGQRTVWNAKLHPVIVANRYQGGRGGEEAFLFVANTPFMYQPLFSWITALRHINQEDMNGNRVLSENATRSLHAWKQAERISMAEIRELADASAESEYRNCLAETIIPIMKQKHYRQVKDIVLKRQHQECNLKFVVENFAANGRIDDLLDVLHALDEVVREGLQRSEYDVSSRAFMVMSALLVDMAKVANRNVVGFNVKQCTEALASVTDCHIERDIYNLRLVSVFSKKQRLLACDRLLSHRDKVLNGSSGAFWKCANYMENAALALIALYIADSAHGVLDKYQRCPVAPANCWVTASAPARIDLAGAWSDTPPICYEFGGAVSCLAVKIGGRNPLYSRCRTLLGGKGILLKTENRDYSGNLVSEKLIEINEINDLMDFHDPRADGALLKCALLYLGLFPPDAIQGRSDEELQPLINSFCHSNYDVRLEIVSTSHLPVGSGLGSSSILGGCLIAAIARCVGMDILSTNDESKEMDGADHLIQAVLTLEQLLTTGGGWQDQVGGLVGGLKLGSSESQSYPFRVKVKHMKIHPHVRTKLEDRLILVFTGHPRLAKNILQNVLKNWARRNPLILTTVEKLVILAKEAANAVANDNLNKLGDCLNDCWEQKKRMAGEHSGVEPKLVKRILAGLSNRPEFSGGSLCGAGGGGFMILLAAEGWHGTHLQKIVETNLKDLDEAGRLSWHGCCISESGITLNIEDH